MIAECLCASSHTWNLGFRRSVFDRELGDVVAILEVLNSWVPQGGSDCLKWKLDSSGKFTTKATFLNITKRTSYPLVNLVWKLKIPKNVKFFLGPLRIEV